MAAVKPPVLNAQAQQKLAHEQVVLLYESIAGGQFATLINAVVLIGVLWPVVDHAVMLGWLAVLVLISAGRMWSRMAFQRHQSDETQSERWWRVFLIGSLASAAVWGSAGWLLFHETSLAHQVFLAFVSGGMAAGGGMMLAPRRMAAFSFPVLVVGPLAVHFLLLGTEISLPMGGLLLLFLCLILYITNNIHQTVTQNIMLRWQEIEHEAEVRKAEQRLVESERTYHGIFNSLKEAVYIQDAEGRFLDVNEGAVRMYGYPREAFIGKTPEFLSAPGRNDMDAVKKCIARAMRGEAQSFEFWGRDAAGREFPKEVHLYPGEYFGRPAVIAVAQDISERRRMEAQLLQAQKMEALGTLVGGIAHDFNNTLAGITGNVYLARGMVDKDSPIAERLNKIDELCFHAADMIRQMLAFARRHTLEMKPVALAPLIKEAVRLASVGVPESIRVDVQIVDGDATILGDATQLQQIVVNLMNNARDALRGRSAPVITVRLGKMDVDDAFRKLWPEVTCERMAVLSVSDNGPGIPEEVRDRIFDPFFTTKKVGEGTGLGLAMVYGAVQSHGGVVEVDSEEGKGTTFRLYFPLLPEEAGGELKNKEEEFATGGGEVILLADDEQKVREAMASVLTRLGYHVLACADGAEAVDVFANHADRVALVILDLVMPNMGGIEAAQSIRKMKPDTPIICMTGYDPEREFGQEKPKCCDAILQKPCSISELSQTIRKLIDS